jgi:hypothetical protein
VKNPLVFGVLFLVGCGSGSAAVEVEGPNGHDEPVVVASLDHLPSTTFAIIRVDGAALRASPYREILEGWVAQLGDQLRGTRFAALDVAGFIDATDEAVIGFATPGGDDVEFVAVFRGRYQADALRQALAGLRDEGGTPMFLEKTRGAHRLFVQTGEGEIAVLDDGTVLAGSEGHVVPMLERHAGQPGASPLEHPAARAMAERIDLASAPAAFLLRVNELVVSELEGDIPMRSVDAIGIRGDLSNGLELRAIFATRDVAAASTIASQIEGLVARARGEAMLAMMGVGPILAGTSSRVESTDAIVETRVSERDVRNLLGRLSALVPAMLASMVAEIE